MLDIAPSKQAAAWLGSLAKALEARDPTAAAGLFVEDCYWRDLLAFTWNIKTMEGREAIARDARSDAGDGQPGLLAA